MDTNGVARRDALAERLFEATIGALELFSVQLGSRLELYRVLADAGPLRPAELAEAGGIDERYAREWLEQQAVAGFVDVDDPSVSAAERRYHLPAGHGEVLADPESLAHMAPFAGLVSGIGGALPDVVAAYRTGGGVPYSRYGADLRDGQGAANRPAFTREMGTWLAAAPDLHDRLSTADPPARVADLACGQGWSSLGIASAYPSATVVGIDLDEASIVDARRNARGHDAADRVGFDVADATVLVDSGPYDLVCIFEALHDMARPVEVLAAARTALAPTGSVLVMDERVADEFTAPGDPVERMMYGWSVTHCLPASLAEQPSAALGTVLRAGTMRELATEAGFAEVDVLPVENDFFRFYLLRR